MIFLKLTLYNYLLMVHIFSQPAKIVFLVNLQEFLFYVYMVALTRSLFSPNFLDLESAVGCRRGGFGIKCSTIDKADGNSAAASRVSRCVRQRANIFLNCSNKLQLRNTLYTYWFPLKYRPKKALPMVMAMQYSEDKSLCYSCFHLVITISKDMTAQHCVDWEPFTPNNLIIHIQAWVELRIERLFPTMRICSKIHVTDNTTNPWNIYIL